MDLNSTVNILEVHRHPDDFIKENAKCEKKYVKLMDTKRGTAESYLRKVGMCYLSAVNIKCVTKGPREDTVYVYSFHRALSLCENPIERNFRFSSEASTPPRGFLYFLSCLKFW